MLLNVISCIENELEEMSGTYTQLCIAKIIILGFLVLQINRVLFQYRTKKKPTEKKPMYSGELQVLILLGFKKLQSNFKRFFSLHF